MTLITNHYRVGASRRALPVERAWVYRPSEKWTYSHHPHLAFFRGRFHAMWSNAPQHEDEPGQRVLTASSDDFVHWSRPRPLVDSQRGQAGLRVLTAAGWHQDGGTLVAYYSRFEHDPAGIAEGPGGFYAARHVDVRLMAVTSENGRHWSDPIDLHLPVVGNHGPRPTASGRLILCGHLSLPHTDQSDGLGGWTMAGLYAPDPGAPFVDDFYHVSATAKAAGWPTHLAEACFVQSDDGVIHVFLRSQENRLWRSVSRDDGETFSAPEPTDFTDDGARSHLGRLPDGRFYHVGTPDPHGRQIVRSPLVLSISRDGADFDTSYILADSPYEMQRDGFRKPGQYGYPHTLIREGFLHVIVSRRKEAIEVLRVDIAAL